MTSLKDQLTLPDSNTTGTRLARRLVKRLQRSHARARLKHRLTLWTSFAVNALRLWPVLANARFLQRRPVVVISQVVHLGDIVACEPVVRHVRKRQPNALIVFCIDRRFRELADSHPDVDYTLAVTCIFEWALFERWKALHNAVDLNIDGRTCDACGSPWHKSAGSRGVTVENFLAIGPLLKVFTKIAGIEITSIAPVVYPRASDCAAVDELRLPERYIVLHTASNEPIKDVPVTLWERIVRHINQQWQLPVIEIGLSPKVITKCENGNRSLCGHLSILQSAEVIRRSVCFLGGDSGPAHLANAIGAYGVILLGHYRNFSRYQLYTGRFAAGEGCEIVFHDGPVAELPTELAIQAVDCRLISLTTCFQT